MKETLGILFVLGSILLIIFDNGIFVKIIALLWVFNSIRLAGEQS